MEGGKALIEALGRILFEAVIIYSDARKRATCSAMGLAYPTAKHDRTREVLVAYGTCIVGLIHVLFRR